MDLELFVCRLCRFDVTGGLGGGLVGGDFWGGSAPLIGIVASSRGYLQVIGTGDSNGPESEGFEKDAVFWSIWVAIVGEAFRIGVFLVPRVVLGVVADVGKLRPSFWGVRIFVTSDIEAFEESDSNLLAGIPNKLSLRDSWVRSRRKTERLGLLWRRICQLLKGE